MDYRKIADTALLAGLIMLESNAETYRVEETVVHILKTTNFCTTEAFVLTTGITMTLDDDTIEAITMVRRVKKRAVNLHRIHAVNSISRQIVDGTISIDDAYDQLKNLTETEYSATEFYISNILLACAFTIMLGGSARDAIITFLNVVSMILLWIPLKRLQSSLFMTNVITCTTIAMISVLSAKLLTHDISVNAIIVGSIMPVVPGTLITNAIRDTFRGDYTSGVARGIEAINVGFSIAIGITIGLLITNGGQYIL